MVNAMTRYADDRARYDTAYIRDVYESVEAASSQFKLPSIQRGRASPRLLVI